MIRNLALFGALVLGACGAASIACAAPALPPTAFAAPAPLMQQVQAACGYNAYGQYFCLPTPYPTYGYGQGGYGGYGQRGGGYGGGYGGGFGRHGGGQGGGGRHGGYGGYR